MDAKTPQNNHLCLMIWEKLDSKDQNGLTLNISFCDSSSVNTWTLNYLLLLTKLRLKWEAVHLREFVIIPLSLWVMIMVIDWGQSAARWMAWQLADANHTYFMDSHNTSPLLTLISHRIAGAGRTSSNWQVQPPAKVVSLQDVTHHLPRQCSLFFPFLIETWSTEGINDLLKVTQGCPVLHHCCRQRHPSLILLELQSYQPYHRLVGPSGCAQGSAAPLTTPSHSSDIAKSVTRRQNSYGRKYQCQIVES